MVQFILLLLFVSTNSYAQNALSVSAKDINEILRSNGKVSTWLAEDNGIFEKYFAGKEKPIFGLRTKPRKNIKGSLITDESPIPTKLDWRNFAGQNWLTPVKNQGSCGSCVAFSNIGTVEAHFNIINNSSDTNLDLSEQQLFMCGGANCKRGWFSTAGYVEMEKEGTTDEACVPYKIGNTGLNESCSNACQNSFQRLFRIRNTVYYSINYGWDNLKKAIMIGPISTTMRVYEDFMLYKSGIYKHVTGKNLGGHAVIIVGFNDEERYFIVKNSWGKSWGENGYFRISYDERSMSKSGDMPKLYPIEGVLKIESPAYREIVSGTVHIAGSTTLDNINNPILYITNHQKKEPIASVPLTNLLETQFDSKAFPDGTYDLYIKSNESKAQILYTSIFILNDIPEVSMSFKKDFNGSDLPIKAPFKFECNYKTVELSHVKFSIKGPELDKEITKHYPCPLTILKINTEKYLPGEYIFSAVGYTGEHEFTLENSILLNKK